MNNTELQCLKDDGFIGFKTIKELKMSMAVVPAEKGVYVVFRPNDRQPEFLQIGTGGFFKQKNPNIPVSELATHWVEESSIVYIGKAGGKGKATLKSRIGQYMRFGKGCSVGHWGGRLIWQLKDADDLVVCWKKTEEDPRGVEKKMIKDFKEQYNGRRPYANLKD